MAIITALMNLLWGDLITIPLPGGGSIDISLLVLLLIPAGIFFTFRTRFVLIRFFPEMLRLTFEKNDTEKKGALSGLQALILSTATRVGMGNMVGVGVVAAVSAGGFGAALMNGVKRGLFSNEAGCSSAPCAASTANVSHPAKAGLLQSFGVFIDTIVICTCTAMIMLLAPQDTIAGLEGMNLLQESMRFHFGEMGVIFIAVTLWLCSFSTFVGVLYYARSNVAFLFGDSMKAQFLFKLRALGMLFVGGLAAYSFVWDLGDIGIGLMTVFNMLAIVPMSGQAVKALEEYKKLRRQK